MTEKDKQVVEFKVGDRVVYQTTNEKGTISGLCADKNVIYVRWDESKEQEMVEVSALRKEQAGE